MPKVTIPKDHLIKELEKQMPGLAEWLIKPKGFKYVIPIDAGQEEYSLLSIQWEKP